MFQAVLRLVPSWSPAWRELGWHVRFVQARAAKQLSHLLKLEKLLLLKSGFGDSLGESGNFWAHQFCLLRWQPWTVVVFPGQGLCSPPSLAHSTCLGAGGPRGTLSTPASGSKEELEGVHM